MYKNNQNLKAKSTFIKGVFSLFLLLQSSFIFSQEWEYAISKDYEFSIQDVWGENDYYEAKFVLSNAKTAFVKKVIITKDNIGKLVFPDGFIQTRGKFNKDTITNFNWYIEVNKQRVALGKIIYNPSPNTVLQLAKYNYLEFKNKKVIWGDVIDAYKWEDKTGENVFIRSKRINVDNRTIHLYFYHFIKEDEAFILSRKLTDFVKNCDLDNFANHTIESIELTDIDKDTIAEVSFNYTVDCSCLEDSLPRITKLMLFTKGEKYAIRGITSPRYKNSLSEYEVGGNVLKNDLYRRFLIKKWKKLIGEQETIYN